MQKTVVKFTLEAKTLLPGNSEISRRFDTEYNPEDFSGGLVFEDWDAAEWTQFGQFLRGCILGYVAQNNHPQGTVKKSSGPTFNDFASSKFKLGEKYTTAVILKELKKMKVRMVPTQHKLVRSMREYGASKGWDLLDKVERNSELGSKSKTQRVYIFVERGTGLVSITSTFNDFASSRFKLGEKYISTDLLAELRAHGVTEEITPKRIRMEMEKFGQLQGWELVTKFQWDPSTSKTQRFHVFVEKGSTANSDTTTHETPDLSRTHHRASTRFKVVKKIKNHKDKK